MVSRIVPFGRKYRVLENEKRIDSVVKHQLLNSALLIMKIQNKPLTMMFNKSNVPGALNQARKWVRAGQLDAAGTLLSVVAKMINGGKKK